MNEKERAVMEQALEFCESVHGGCTDSDDGTVEAITVWCPEIIEALRTALARPVEPVKPAFYGFMSADGTQVDLCFTPGTPRSDGVYATAYYTTPPKA